MIPGRLPALPWAAGALAGALAATRLAVLPVPWLGALLAVAIAARGASGAVLGGGALALLRAAVARPREVPAPPGPLDPERPVELLARMVLPWERDGSAWISEIAVERLRQGRWVGACGARVRVELAGSTGAPPAGRLRLKGFLDRRAAPANGPSPPPGPWRLRVKHPLLARREAPPEPLAAALLAWRGAVARVLPPAGEAGAPSPGRGLARALLLGRTDAVSARWQAGLRRAGLSHLLSVSGLHVAMAAAAALAAGWWLPRGPRAAAALAAVAAYAGLVGGRASLLRAAAMAGLALAGTWRGRPPATANALAVACAGLLLAEPAWAADLGFQLSFAATAGMVALAPALARAWVHLPAAPARALAATAAAQLATLPLALPAFHVLPLAAPLLNLVYIPWTALVLVASSLWVGLRLFAPAAGEATGAWLDALAAPFGWPAALPPAAWWCPVLTAGPLASAVAAGLLAAFLLRPSRTCALLIPPLAAAVLALGVGRSAPGQGVVFLDVGQGDAALLRDGGAGLLVDGGGWRSGDFGARVLLPALVRLGLTRLEAVVMTHPDRDHCGGLVDLLGAVPVAEVWMGPGWAGSPCAVALAAGPARLRVLWAGEERRWRTWRLRVLHPPPGERGRDNERSLVLLASAAGRRALLAGDIGRLAEGRLVAEAPAGDLACDLLKVPHHGSAGSSGPGLLAAASPALAVVSAGTRNPYGHPAASVLARLRGGGCAVLRTDRDGQVGIAWRPGAPWRITLPYAPPRR